MKMKNKIYNIILTILLIALLVVAIIIAIKYGKNHLNEEKLKTVVDEVKVQIEQNKEDSLKSDNQVKKVNVEYKGYNVVRNNRNTKIKIRISNY